MATTPASPDAWVRGSPGEGWTFSKDPPHGHEVASTIGFRCADCRKVLRLILAPDRR
jgi:hypothetical protein